MDVPKANVVLINTRRVFSRGRHVFVVAALTLVATLVGVVVAAGKIDSTSIASRSTGTFSTGTFSTDTFSINATTADDVPRPAPPSVIARLRVFAQYAAVASYCAAGEDPRPRACVVDWERCVDRLAAVDGLDLIAAAAAAVDVKPRPFLVQRVGATEDVDMVSMFLHSRPESSSSSSSSFSSAPVMAPVLTHGTRVLATFSSYSSDEWAV